jgi:hypothetical protein
MVTKNIAFFLVILVIIQILKTLQTSFKFKSNRNQFNQNFFFKFIKKTEIIIIVKESQKTAGWSGLLVCWMSEYFLRGVTMAYGLITAIKIRDLSGTKQLLA